MISVTGCKSEVDGLLWEQEDARSIRVTPIASYFTGTLDTKPNQPYNTKATIQNNVSDSKVQKGC